MGEWVRAPKKALGRLREVRVHFGLFNFAVYCVAGPYQDLPAYVAYRHKETDTDYVLAAASMAEACYVRNDPYAPIIWLPGVPRTPQQYGALAHEVLHILRILGEWAGIHFGDDTDEVYCHGMSYAVAEIAEELRK